MHWSIADGCCLQSLFFTEQGYNGFGVLQNSDEVWVLFGGYIPFLLRPHLSDPGYHVLTGLWYLHGIMDGEAVKGHEQKTVMVKLRQA